MSIVFFPLKLVMGLLTRLLIMTLALSLAGGLLGGIAYWLWMRGV